MSIGKVPIIKQAGLHLDDRGYLSEILRCDDTYFTKFGQVYISTINPGTVKGFHIHQKKEDVITCISGQVKFVIIESNDNNDLIKLYEVHMSPMNRQIVVVPPGLWHGWMCVGNKEAVLVNVTTEPYFAHDPDEVRADPINNPWGYVWEVKHG